MGAASSTALTPVSDAAPPAVGDGGALNNGDGDGTPDSNDSGDGAGLSVKFEYGVAEDGMGEVELSGEEMRSDDGDGGGSAMGDGM